jgi:hypothetical protein
LDEAEIEQAVLDYLRRHPKTPFKICTTEIATRNSLDVKTVESAILDLRKRGSVISQKRAGLSLASTQSPKQSHQERVSALYLEAKDETTEELSEEARALYDLIPPDPSKPITNKKLQEEFRRKLSLKSMSTAEFLEFFYKYKQELVDQDKIERRRMRGGGVAVTESALVSKPSMFVRKEEELYPYLEKYLKKEKVPELHGENWQVWVCDTSRSNIPGRWSRPDVTLVKTRHFDFAPGTEFVVTGYEVKQNRDKDNIAGVFEAASHSARCHECYLLVETSEDRALDDPPLELRRDLRRFGVGFCWLYRDKDGNYSFEEIWQSGHHSPILKDEHQLLEAIHGKLPQDERQSFKTAVQAARGAVG